MMRCRLGLHRWVEVQNTGKHSYRACSICGVRDVVELFPGGYQPIDPRWLAGRKLR